MDTEQLARAASQGDDEAFYLLINAEKERLYRIAYSYLRNEADALEAIQETTCRAYGKLRQLKEPKYFLTWYIRILIHCCIDEQKRRRRAFFPWNLSERAPEPQGDTDDKLELEEAIGKLEPRYRHVIILKYYQDMTLTEIARLLEKPEGTIKTWLHKALAQLRQQIGREGGNGYVET
ncbi:sigma-70 family RNA polymerase sigma factor [Cohnella terricola]|uniref:Sigma-70 family RNA polymerase sigma factor n=1 Tax=Cohnella terricola TaxID=1289167 RepID=A0A559JIH4_9BACL|nr:sigma-70 family RNA polymerase sigma factor [Cohnella terricola]TVX99672.1 sigma-70 family RNA polymerase sigma factor [Cohnella terricola]